MLGSELCPGAVAFINTDIGYLVTKGSAVGAAAMRKTTDGGDTWMTINYNFPSNHQNGLFFVDEHTGYYAGGDGFTIYKTSDGGASWVAKNTGTNNSVIEAIHFFNKDTGLIAGWYGPKIARTTDGGDTWVDVSNSYGIYRLNFPSNMIGYAVGSNNVNTPVIVKTADAGMTWNIVYISTVVNSPFFFSSIHCLDDNVCYAIGDSGTILKTTNGGNTWEKQISGTLVRLNSISCIKSKACYIVGNDGIMLKNTVEVGIESIRNKQNNLKVYPNPFAVSATIELDERIDNATLQIYNVLGQKMKEVTN